MAVEEEKKELRARATFWVSIIPVLILPLVAACGVSGPDGRDQPDMTQTLGTLLTREGVYRTSNLVWIPGSELVAFIHPTTEGCVVKTVDVASGSTTVFDGDCDGLFYSPPNDVYLRNLVVASDGSALYYTVPIGDFPQKKEQMLRVADPVNGGVTTLRSGVYWALALSPDGQQLAYVSLDSTGRYYDSLIVRDLSSGAETHYGNGTGPPFLFSTDGTELLYYVNGPGPAIGGGGHTTLRRLSLSDGTSGNVSLPDAYKVQLFHWDASALQGLVCRPDGCHVRNLTTGGLIQVGALETLESLQWHGFAWSTDGTRVAYWTFRCFESEGLFGPCINGRSALYVADTRSGTRVRVAYTKAANAGPTVFSPDGRRIVYGLDGGLYVSDVL